MPLQFSYNPLAGKRGRITVNNTIMSLSEHEVRPQVEDIDTTHFESDVDNATGSVFEQGICGILGAEVMVRGAWDGLQNRFDSPVLLYPGAFGSAFLGLTKTFGFTVPYRCLSTPVSVGVKGKAGFEARVKSNGLFSLPTGQVNS